MDPEPKPKWPRWYVFGGDPGNHVDRYCDNIDEVLDFCGRLLYGNVLFDVLLLSIRREQAGLPESISDGTSSNLKDETQWVMTILDKEGKRERQLNTTHEMFSMIVAELRLGTDFVDVRHVSNVAQV